MYVVLYVNDGYANIWTDAYIKRQPQARKKVLMPAMATTQQVEAAIKSAVNMAGPSGTLIFNVGHGGTSGTSTTDGFVDLAPNKIMRLGGFNQKDVFVDVFYDMNVQGPPAFSQMNSDVKFYPNTQGAKERQAGWIVYQSISSAIKQEKLYRVIFLTCRVGNSIDFPKKIALDWGAVIEAFKDRVVLSPQASGNVRIHLDKDSPGFGTNIQVSEEELPLATESNSVRVGPPL